MKSSDLRVVSENSLLKSCAPRISALYSPPRGHHWFTIPMEQKPVNEKSRRFLTTPISSEIRARKL